MLVSPWPCLLNLLRREDQEELGQSPASVDRRRWVPTEKKDEAWSGFLGSFL